MHVGGRHEIEGERAIERDAYVPTHEQRERGLPRCHEMEDNGRGNPDCERDEKPGASPNNADRFRCAATAGMIGRCHWGVDRALYRAAKVSLNSRVHFSPSSRERATSTKSRPAGAALTFGLVGTASRSVSIFWPSVRMKSS